MVKMSLHKMINPQWHSTGLLSVINWFYWHSLSLTSILIPSKINQEQTQVIASYLLPPQPPPSYNMTGVVSIFSTSLSPKIID